MIKTVSEISVGDIIEIEEEKVVIDSIVNLGYETYIGGYTEADGEDFGSLFSEDEAIKVVGRIEEDID